MSPKGSENFHSEALAIPLYRQRARLTALAVPIVVGPVDGGR